MVLDASGAIEFLMNTAFGKRLAPRLTGVEPVCVPHLIDVEVAHVLRRAVARGALAAERGAMALDDWFDVEVERYAHAPLLERVWQLRENVSAYDAVYVALAESLSMVLVTADRRLAAAPGLRARIEIL